MTLSSLKLLVDWENMIKSLLKFNLITFIQLWPHNIHNKIIFWQMW